MKAAAVAAILDAAEKVFAAAGFHVATTAEIARQAGVSKGLVFNYFPTKDDLLAEIVRRRLGQQLTFWRELRLEGSPEAQLRQIVDRGLDAVVQHPDAHRLYLSLLVQPGTSQVVREAVASLAPAVAEYYTLLERLFKALGSKTPKVSALLFQTSMAGVAQVLTIQPDLARKPALFPLAEMKKQLVNAALPSRAPRRRATRKVTR